MTLRKYAWWAMSVALLGTLSAFQAPFREYPGVEYRLGDIPLPTDYAEKTEWTFARLMYPQGPGGRYGRGYGFGFRGGGSSWTEGNSIWTQDYPRADRHFAAALRRLSLVQARSVEQPVNLDDGDDVFNYPWMNAGEMGDWKLTDAQAVSLREYLLRGGFLMLDDFWGAEEWNRFNESMRRVFPDRAIVEIDNADSIFHVVYDLSDRYLIPGQWGLNRDCLCRNGGGSGGQTVHWRGIYDDHGRVMVAMTFNSDVGDSWEWADDPGYPEKYSALGIRIGVNYVIYSMTH
jgi:hypothetical protein